MSSQPWKTDNWFVSPWNFAPEVRQEFKFAPKIKVHDITLRDGEQQAGIEFNKDDKIAIAEALAEAGVHRIEAGMPAVSPSDEAAIREIVKRNLGPEIFAFSRCMVEDVKRELMESVEIARKAGIPDERIILDPGIGFGKKRGDGCCSRVRNGAVFDEI